MIYLSLIIAFGLLIIYGEIFIRKYQISSSNIIQQQLHVIHMNDNIVYNLSFSSSESLNYIKFSLDYELPKIAKYDNLFQTAKLNSGIRFEYAENNATVLLSDENQNNKLQGFRIPIHAGWHNIQIEALQDKFININYDGRAIEGTNGYIPHFDINEIAFGKGYSDSRVFSGNFKNINVETRTVKTDIWPELLLTGMKILVFFVIVIFLYFVIQENRYHYRSNSDDQSYIYLLFYFYVGYFCIMFSTNIYVAHPVSYWPFIILVAAPFRWSWRKIFGLQFPLPTELSFINISTNISYCLTSIMISYILYIANKGVISSIAQTNIPYVDFYFTEYFIGLMAFSIGFIRIAVEFENFSMWFFLSLAPFVAFNGVVNIHNYVDHLPELTPDTTLPRLFTTFGPGVDIGSPTSAALTYAYYIYGFVMSLITILANKQSVRMSVLIGAFYFLPMLFAMLLTQSRGGVIGLSIAAIVSVFIFYPIKKIGKKNIKYIIFAAITVFFLLSPPVKKYFTARSDQHRLEVWRIFLGFARDNFLFGVGDRGLGGLKHGETQIFNVKMLDGEVIHHAHNIFLNALLRGGVIGLISLVYLIISSLKTSYKYAITKKNSIPLGGLIIFVISSQVDFDLHIYPAPWMLTSNWTPILLAAAIGSMNRCRKNIYEISCDQLRS